MNPAQKNLSAGQYFAAGGAALGAIGGIVDQVAQQGQLQGQPDSDHITPNPQQEFDWQKALPWIIGGAVIVILIIAAVVVKRT